MDLNIVAETSEVADLKKSTLKHQNSLQIYFVESLFAARTTISKNAT